MKKFIVFCQVSGGVTGFRQSPLKHNGQVVYFETRQEAEAHALHLKQNVSPYAKADFQYTAQEAE